MTREEATAKLKWYLDSNLIEDISGCEGVEEAISMAINALEAQRWTLTSKKPPDENQAYFITNIYGDVAWNYWINGEWVVLPDSVVAWMPLPEPYRGETDEK